MCRWGRWGFPKDCQLESRHSRCSLNKLDLIIFLIYIHTTSCLNYFSSVLDVSGVAELVRGPLSRERLKVSCDIVCASARDALLYSLWAATVLRSRPHVGRRGERDLSVYGSPVFDRRFEPIADVQLLFQRRHESTLQHPRCEWRFPPGRGERKGGRAIAL